MSKEIANIKEMTKEMTNEMTNEITTMRLLDLRSFLLSLGSISYSRAIIK